MSMSRVTAIKSQDLQFSLDSFPSTLRKHHFHIIKSNKQCALVTNCHSLGHCDNLLAFIVIKKEYFQFFYFLFSFSVLPDLDY